MRAALSDRGAMLGAGLGVSQCALQSGPRMRQRMGRALSFGLVDYVTVPDAGQLNQINTVSLEAWVKYTTVGNTVCIEKSSNNTHYQLQIFSGAQGSFVGGELVFMLQPDPTNWVVSGRRSADGKWHHVVGTYSRSTATARIYLDGVLSGTNASIATGPRSNSQPLLINSRSGLGGMAGSVGSVRVSNRVLSRDEIAEHYRGIYSNNDGLVGRWDLDEPDGLIAYDKSGYGNHGTLVGSPQRVQVFRPERLPT